MSEGKKLRTETASGKSLRVKKGSKVKIIKGSHKNTITTVEEIVSVEKNLVKLALVQGNVKKYNKVVHKNSLQIL